MRTRCRCWQRSLRIILLLDPYCTLKNLKSSSCSINICLLALPFLKDATPSDSLILGIPELQGVDWNSLELYLLHQLLSDYGLTTLEFGKMRAIFHKLS